MRRSARKKQQPDRYDPSEADTNSASHARITSTTNQPSENDLKKKRKKKKTQKKRKTINPSNTSTETYERCTSPQTNPIIQRRRIKKSATGINREDNEENIIIKGKDNITTPHQSPAKLNSQNSESDYESDSIENNDVVAHNVANIESILNAAAIVEQSHDGVSQGNNDNNNTNNNINTNTIITSVINSHNNNNDVEDEDIIGMNITRNVANRNNTQKLSKELIECLENDIKPHEGSHNDYCGDFYGENSRDNCKIFGCGAKASTHNKLVRCSYCNNAACLAKTDCNQL